MHQITPTYWTSQAMCSNWFVWATPDQSKPEIAFPVCLHRSISFHLRHHKENVQSQLVRHEPQMDPDKGKINNNNNYRLVTNHRYRVARLAREWGMGLKNKRLSSNSWPAVRIVTNQKHQKRNQANDHYNYEI